MMIISHSIIQLLVFRIRSYGIWRVGVSFVMNLINFKFQTGLRMHTWSVLLKILYQKYMLVDNWSDW